MVLEILETHPLPAQLDRELVAAGVDACADCAPACTVCADSSLAEADVAEMRRSIRLCQDCADVCVTTGRVLARQTEYEHEIAKAMIEACVRACGICAQECEKHAHMHEHCRLCAEVCRRCEAACSRLVDKA
ncbi:MAG TPA: four-helix bundle copper-binding protein [Thermoleophilaceae bacterium]|jgi:hypothetical protein|nr:four-helix bundle copper-binding protein [Thermoleophilaceae bacterium]